MLMTVNVAEAHQVDVVLSLVILMRKGSRALIGEAVVAWIALNRLAASLTALTHPANQTVFHRSLHRNQMYSAKLHRR